MRRSYVGNAAPSTLSTDLGNSTSDRTIYANDLTNWPTGSGGHPFYVTLNRGKSNEEKILCASRSGNVITVYDDGITSGRAADGTSISAHVANETIEHTFTATDADEANAHVNATTGTVHGLALAEVVTTDATQTLTGKTISGSSNTLSSIPQSAVTSLVTDLALKSPYAAYAATAPSSPVVGELWMDTNTSPPIGKVWSGTAWESFSSARSATVSGTTGSPTIDTTSRPGKTIYKFTSAGSITVATEGTAEVLIVGGGGGSSGSYSTFSGGGGWGSAWTGYVTLPAGTHTVAVGVGGIAGTGSAGSNVKGGGGEPSCVGPFQCGGGRGGVHSGGSGTGASLSGATGLTTSITGASVTYAAGGTVGTAAAGGANTGKGANAATQNGSDQNGAAGGSGFVVVVV